MNEVYLSGQGVLCSAGAGRRTTADGLLSGRSHIEMRSVAAGLRPYATIAERCDSWSERLLTLVQRALNEALAEAGLGLEQARQLPMYIGSSSLHAVFGENSKLLQQARALNAACVTLGERLAWRAPVTLYTTACTSSLVALGNACAAVRAGKLDGAIAVGIELDNFTSLNGFSAMGLLSPTAARPFCAGRDGLLLGEAVAVSVVGREGRWRLAAVELGLDPFSPTGLDPAGTPQSRLWQRVLQQADWQAQDIELIKAHAGGSPANDVAEAAALHQLSATLPPIVSLKSMLGHTLGASGLVELAALTACLERGQIPATQGFVLRDEAVDIIPTLHTQACTPRRTLCHWIGFGGSLAAIALEDMAA